MRKIMLFFALSGVILLFAGCLRVPKKISVVSWNVQTFFDSTYHGTEYKEFSRSSQWGEQLYKERVRNLAAAISKTNADIIALEEIENEAVMHDISNFLLLRDRYKYAAFSKNENGVFGCGIFSRYPVQAVSAHQFAIGTEGVCKPNGLRPQVAVTIVCGKEILSFVVCHWKSQSGNTDESVSFRRGQEMVLADIIKEKNALLAVGDFNQDIKLFTRAEQKETVLLRGALHDVPVCALWLLYPDTAPGGSYYYRDNWERIDSIFVENSSGKVLIHSFEVLHDVPFADLEGKPVRFEVYSGHGISDHLPVKALISLSAG